LSQKLLGYERRFALASPELKLKQGYSIVTDEEGKIIKSISQIKIGDNINTKLHKGNFYSSVTQKNDK
jgi:exonuclease VII large subunit